MLTLYSQINILQCESLVHSGVLVMVGGSALSYYVGIKLMQLREHAVFLQHAVVSCHA